MRLASAALVLAMATSLGLAACHRGSVANEHETQGQSATKGTTGTGAAGTATMGGPGAGLNGGLGTSGSASQPTAVPDGSTNRTSRGNVGSR